MNLDYLPPEDVQRNLQIFKQLMREMQPDLDVESGPFHDIVLYYSSIFAADNQYRVKEAFKHININNLLKSADTISPGKVDHFLSNWFVKRKTGTHAIGEVKFTLNAQIPLVVPHKLLLVANECTFKLNDTYAIRTSGGATVLSSDRVLAPSGLNRWAFTLPVIAINVGIMGNLPKGTRLQLSMPISDKLVSVSAATNFTNGTDDENNKQVLERLIHSLSKRD